MSIVYRMYHINLVFFILLLFISYGCQKEDEFESQFILEYNYQEHYVAHEYNDVIGRVNSAFSSAKTRLKVARGTVDLRDSVIPYFQMLAYANANRTISGTTGILLSVQDIQDKPDSDAVGYSSRGPNGYSYVLVQPLQNFFGWDGWLINFSVAYTCTHELRHQRGILGNSAPSGNYSNCCVMRETLADVVNSCGMSARVLFCDGHKDFLRSVS